MLLIISVSSSIRTHCAMSCDSVRALWPVNAKNISSCSRQDKSELGEGEEKFPSSRGPCVGAMVKSGEYSVMTLETKFCKLQGWTETRGKQFFLTLSSWFQFSSRAVVPFNSEAPTSHGNLFNHSPTSSITPLLTFHLCLFPSPLLSSLPVWCHCYCAQG